MLAAATGYPPAGVKVAARAGHTRIAAALAHDGADAGMNVENLGDPAPAHTAVLRAVAVAHAADLGHAAVVQARPGDDSDRAADAVLSGELGEEIVGDVEAVVGQPRLGVGELLRGRRRLFPILGELARLVRRRRRACRQYGPRHDEDE